MRSASLVAAGMFTFIGDVEVGKWERRKTDCVWNTLKLEGNYGRLSFAVALFSLLHPLYYLYLINVINSLYSTAIAALLHHIDRPRVLVGIGGALIQFHPTYETMLREQLTKLAPEGVDVSLLGYQGCFIDTILSSVCLDRNMAGVGGLVRSSQNIIINIFYSYSGD
jgi:hypothetical protein